MFERFTQSARTVVVDAHGQARAMGHRHIGTEHLLLALLRPESGAPSAILLAAGITAEQVKADIVRMVGAGLDRLGEADAAALEAIGIDLGAVRAKLEETFGPGALEPEPSPTRRGAFGRKVTMRGPGGHLGLTPRTKKVLELSLREALRLKHRYIGTEHLMLGVLREGQGLASQILAEAHVDVGDLRRQLEHSLSAAA